MYFICFQTLDNRRHRAVILEKKIIHCQFSAGHFPNCNVGKLNLNEEQLPHWIQKKGLAFGVPVRGASTGRGPRGQESCRGAQGTRTGILRTSVQMLSCTCTEQGAARLDRGVSRGDSRRFSAGICWSSDMQNANTSLTTSGWHKSKEHVLVPEGQGCKLVASGR